MARYWRLRMRLRRAVECLLGRLVSEHGWEVGATREVIVVQEWHRWADRQRFDSE